MTSAPVDHTAQPLSGTGDPVSPADPGGVEAWEIERLELLQRVESLRVIEQARGVLMGHAHIDAAEAFARLRSWSIHHGLRMRLISEVLIEAAATHGPGPRSARPRLASGDLPSVIDRLDRARAR